MYKQDQHEARIDAREEQATHAYERIADEVEAAHRTEWEEAFGGNPKFPFAPNTKLIHEITTQRMAQARHDGSEHG